MKKYWVTQMFHSILQVCCNQHAVYAVRFVTPPFPTSGLSSSTVQYQVSLVTCVLHFLFLNPLLTS